MGYKTIILNADTYNRVSMAKKKMENRLNQKLSFGGLFDQVFGKSLDFIDIDKGLYDYISSFSDRLSENRNVVGVLLFGSVSKPYAYDRYSDIDILVVVSNRKDVSETMDYIHKIKREMRDDEISLSSKQQPTFINPIVIEQNELRNFKPIYLDFLDYGIILFQRKKALTGFLNEMRSIKHKREYKPYEVLTWQK